MYAAESDSSDLAYVASDYVAEIDYEDFADHFTSSSIGALPTTNMEKHDELPLAQLDGALTDGVSSDSEDEEKGEPEKNPGRAPSGTSSVSSEETMDTDAGVEKIDAACSGKEIHSECWPDKCIQVPPDSTKESKGDWKFVKGRKRPAPAASPKDIILNQLTSSYEEDLTEAMDLSRRHLDDEKDEDADLEEAVERSLRETTKESSENEQIKLAIKASLEEIVKNGTAVKYPSRTL